VKLAWEVGLVSRNQAWIPGLIHLAFRCCGVEAQGLAGGVKIRELPWPPGPIAHAMLNKPNWIGRPRVEVLASPAT
jgi:hypothetical protein